MNKQILSGKVRVSVYMDPFNKRMRIDDYSGPLPEVIKIIQQEMAEWVEKVILKSRIADVTFFLSAGYAEEAQVKNYFRGENMSFVVKYFSNDRGVSRKLKEEQTIIEQILGSRFEKKEEAPIAIQFATIQDADDLSKLYKTVFKVYPTPLSEAAYVSKTIEEGTVYAFIRENGKIISAASAEINLQYRNAEMTDCASLTEAEGKGYMKRIISVLEKRLSRSNINCLYSIARAESFSMNKVFYQLGYLYNGRLINNCYVYSGLEDMNVWVKVGNEGKEERLKMKE